MNVYPLLLLRCFVDRSQNHCIHVAIAMCGINCLILVALPDPLRIGAYPLEIISAIRSALNLISN